MFSDLDLSTEAVIIVFGVGGAGCNAVNEMIRRNDSSVEYVAINSDAQALKSSSADKVIQIGLETSKGLGCGAEPEQGAKAAMESAE
ncbi:cell division protein FtsZ, partial [Staphylococcus pasteuri_A]|nr:cell division protein FtsZ [Staphylococcus pasteuri_A]